MLHLVSLVQLPSGEVDSERRRISRKSQQVSSSVAGLSASL